MSPAFWFFFGAAVGAAVCSTVKTWFRQRLLDDLDASYRAESDEVDAIYMAKIEALTAQVTTPTRGPCRESE